MSHLNRRNEARREIARKYIEGINNPKVILPLVPDYAEPVWHIFGIRCEDCEALEKHLSARGIGTNKHYPMDRFGMVAGYQVNYIEVIDFCITHDVHVVSVLAGYIDDPGVKLLHQYGIRTIVAICDYIEDMWDYCDNGTYMAVSNWLYEDDWDVIVDSP